MGLQPLFLSNFEKLTHGYLLFFTNIAVQFIYKKTYFSTCKRQKTQVSLQKFTYLSRSNKYIQKKREQHDMNKLFNGI